jgi:hypothetical protein
MFRSPVCLLPTCLRAQSKLPGGEKATTIPTPALHTSRAAAALQTEIGPGVHQTLTAPAAPPMPLAFAAPANTAPRTKHGTATANTEGGGARQTTTRAQVAIRLRSLAVWTRMTTQSSRPQLSQETGTP